MIVNSIIDIYYENSIPDMATVAKAGVTHIIHKCTEGLSFIDPAYAARRASAKDNGIAWGSYHFATGDDPIAQAKHYLATAQPGSDTLIALDLEAEPGGNSMTLAQANAWVEYVHLATGRWPWLYTGFYVLQDLGWQGVGSLANCPLWLAAYNPDPLVPRGWSDWALHQYTNGTDGPLPRAFPGLAQHDRSEFKGSIDQLNAIWAALPGQSNPQSAVESF